MGYEDSLPARGFTAGASQLLIVATQNGTIVGLTPSCNSGALVSGQPASIALNQGQTYQVQCVNFQDVTGTRLVSNRPIAVLGGNSCADIPRTVAACDVLSEMLLPISSGYGTEFVSAPLPGNSSDLIRVIAAQDGTVVTVNSGGAPTALNLNANQFQDLRIEPGTKFTSNQPISVTQYAVGLGQAGIGDPFQMQLIPTHAWRQSFRLYSPSGFANGTFAVITAPNGAVPSVTLNGAIVGGFQPLPGGTHQYRLVPVPIGQSVITASQPITVYGVGFGNAISYGYPAGF